MQTVPPCLTAALRPATRRLTLPAPEFLQRFLLHVLPDWFQRIRYYGLLGNRYREAKLARCRQLLGMPPAQTTAAEPPLDYRDRYEVETLPGAHGPPAITDIS